MRLYRPRWVLHHRAKHDSYIFNLIANKNVQHKYSYMLSFAIASDIELLNRPKIPVFLLNFIGNRGRGNFTLHTTRPINTKS